MFTKNTTYIIMQIYNKALTEHDKHKYYAQGSELVNRLHGSELVKRLYGNKQQT